MLAIAYAVTGGAYDFYAFDSAGQVYNGSAWVAWDDSDFNDYRIPATESGASGRFVATLPDDTARYAMRASGVDLAGSYLVWEEAVDAGGGGATAQEIWTYHTRTLTDGSGGGGTPMGLRRYLGTIYYGFDYVDTDAIKVSEQSAGEWDSSKLSGSFFMMLTDGRAGSVTVPATLSTNGGINTLSADLEGTLIPKRPGEYQAFFYSVEAGTGSTQDTRLIVPALVTVQRGLSEC